MRVANFFVKEKEKISGVLESWGFFVVKRKLRTVDEILDRLEPEQKEVANKLRSTIRATVQEVTETVRRGRITYVLNDKDFLSIRPTKSHVDLLLLCSFRCESHLLRGTGTGRDLRHVEIRTMKNFDEPELIRLIREAQRIA